MGKLINESLSLTYSSFIAILRYLLTTIFNRELFKSGGALNWSILQKLKVHNLRLNTAQHRSTTLSPLSITLLSKSIHNLLTIRSMNKLSDYNPTFAVSASLAN